MMMSETDSEDLDDYSSSLTKRTSVVAAKMTKVVTKRATYTADEMKSDMARLASKGGAADLSMRAIVEVLRQKPFERSVEALEKVAENIKTSDFFKAMKHDNIVDCCKFMSAEIMNAGRSVIKEGEMGHEMFVLLDGSCHVYKGGKQISTVDVKLSAGRPFVFGHLALSTDMRRNATVRISSKALLGVLAREDFNNFCTGGSRGVQRIVGLLQG